MLEIVNEPRARPTPRAREEAGGKEVGEEREEVRLRHRTPFANAKPRPWPSSTFPSRAPSCLLVFSRVSLCLLVCHCRPLRVTRSCAFCVPYVCQCAVCMYALSVFVHVLMVLPLSDKPRDATIKGDAAV